MLMTYLVSITKGCNTANDVSCVDNSFRFSHRDDRPLVNLKPLASLYFSSDFVLPKLQKDIHHKFRMAGNGVPFTPNCICELLSMLWYHRCSLGHLLTDLCKHNDTVKG